MQWRKRGRFRNDDGVATVFACICVLALLAVTVIVLHLGAAVLARYRAENAADLGALAGAAVVLRGEDAACRRAAGIVAANGAQMDTCRLDRLDVRVTVSVSVRVGPVSSQAVGRARAGPAAD